MKELLETYAYLIIIAIIILAGSTSKILDAIGILDHPVVSAIIGVVLGLITIFIFPTAVIAACIVTIIATVLSNLILTQIW